MEKKNHYASQTRHNKLLCVFLSAIIHLIWSAELVSNSRRVRLLHYGCTRFEKHYLVPERVALDRVLCRQTDAAEQDEEEDEVGEDVVVDDLMAQNPESMKKKQTPKACE